MVWPHATRTDEARLRVNPFGVRASCGNNTRVTLRVSLIEPPAFYANSAEHP